MKEAMFWEGKEDNKVQCHLCPHNCLLSKGEIGNCKARQNIDGKLYSLVWGKVSSIALDPIEKKPLYHFYPGSYILSLGTFGCNFHCDNCQNWQISQQRAPTEFISPEQVVALAKTEKRNVGIAYTYNEPFIWYEFVLECARLAKSEGLKNVLVTNGYINEEPLLNLLPFIDAMNVDVKAMKEDFYRKICKGKLSPVLHTVELAHSKGVHIEVTNLIIPTLNDKEEDFLAIADWLSSIDKSIPLHFTRYFPAYKMSLPPTPLSSLIKARELAMKKLDYVYTGNILYEEGETTFCPNCKRAVIIRMGMGVREMHLNGNRCAFCDYRLNIVL
ncbi:AmmeMemoRadiSam system radical SAM enzyme [bacterium]|nr:AmmeMemoRadiSam system radical SAM enzyme [bacterium]